MTLPAMLFAAGFGTRMRPLTDDRPKPLIEVAGRPLIDHALALARGAGLSPLVANAHYKAGMLTDHLLPQGVQVSHETPEILDTGGGLRAALPILGEGPVVTLNTDAIWAGPNPVSLLLEAWDPARMDALLILVPPENAVGRDGPGDFVMDTEGRLTRGAGHVYGGIQIVKTEGLAAIPDAAFSLNLLWDAMIPVGRLHGLLYPGRWCDVGHPGGIALAEEMLKAADV